MGRAPLTRKHRARVAARRKGRTGTLRPKRGLDTRTLDPHNIVEGLLAHAGRDVKPYAPRRRRGVA